MWNRVCWHVAIRDGASSFGIERVCAIARQLSIGQARIRTPGHDVELTGGSERMAESCQINVQSLEVWYSVFTTAAKFFFFFWMTPCSYKWSLMHDGIGL